MAGPPPREGLIVIERMAPRSLQQRSFEVEQTVQVSIEGKGSFQNIESSDGSLAAYPWIVNAKTGELVWQMGRQNAVRSQGTLAEVQDVLKLEAGAYKLFFASYGDRLVDRQNGSSRESTGWERDSRDWYVVLNLIEGKETDIRSSPGQRDQASEFEGERLVWQTGAVGNRANEEFLFNVKQRTPFRIRAAGEFSEGEHDFGYIVNLLNDVRVWQMSLENTSPAGGVAENRRVSEEIYLDPGIYRITYQTDASHAFGSWRGNPPYDPESWGMVLTTRDTSDPIVAFDPWDVYQPVIEMIEEGDDQFEATTFRLAEKQRVVLFGMGELKRNDRYDYGWIERVDDWSYRPDGSRGRSDRQPHPDRLVWEMKYDGSLPAGGDPSNRQALAFVDLVPDVYTIYYKTDGSHSFEHWSHDEPANGNRWGVAIFAVEDAGKEKFEVLEHWEMSEAEREDSDAILADDQAIGAERIPEPPPVPVALPFPPSDILVSLNRLGSDADVSAPLALERRSRLHVIAVGEITPGGNRYDYGYIEKEGSDEVVWEMTLENTQPAGGDESNRVFDGIVELAAGNYMVYFTTDATHDFSGFNTAPPVMPAAWGITIARAE